jgi:alpha-L-rhamnosidase
LAKATRIPLLTPPYRDVPCYSLAEPWRTVSQWPARWVAPPEDWTPPWVAAFRCVFTVKTRLRDRIHVTADARYELYLDGRWIGRGSQRGDKRQWFYESHALDLEPGRHVLVAQVWSLGSLSPWAQISIRPGWFCCPERPELVAKLATGTARWDMLPLRDRTFHDMGAALGTVMGGGPSEIFDSRQTVRGWEQGAGTGWAPAAVGAGGYHGDQPHSTRAEHWLKPAPFPAMRNTPWKRFRIFRAEGDSVPKAAWLELLRKGRAVTIPARTTVGVLIDVEDYLCAYPELHWSGGKEGRISLGWAEALNDPVSGDKRHGTGTAPDSVFKGPCDEVIADGGANRSWRPLWWRCGCYVQLTVQTHNAPLTLKGLTLLETRYPLQIVSQWQTPHTAFNRILAISRRTAEMCLHETYMDCPYYEQLMYAGDTRIQCLLTYALTTDDRPPRQAITLFDSSRLNSSGLVAGSHPCAAGQLIPPFALWWVAMLHDFALWRGQPDFVRERLPGARAVLDLFRRQVDEKGLLHGLAGWNYVDWSFQPGGIPSGGAPGESCAPLQAHWALVLGYMAELEAYAGEPEMAARYRRWKREAVQALISTFWNARRGLLADDVAHQQYSEHTHCLALLAGTLKARQAARVWERMTAATDLTTCTAYFTHYYFEACLSSGRSDLFFRKLQPWFDGVQDGFRTTPENFGGQARSDCHAWTAHPLYHYLTGVLGIQPALFGFESVAIAPQLGNLEQAAGELAHPLGPIQVDARKERGQFSATISLPKGLHGQFRLGRFRKPLRPGKQTIAVPA